MALKRKAIRYGERRNPGALDLDVAAPDQVARVLRRAADVYAEAAMELRSAWQDAAAGAPWARLAKVLDRAALQADKAAKGK